jgi:uncharacterized cupredoxin-like copper-binding protein
MKKLHLILALVALPVLFVACGGQTPAPVNEDAGDAIEVTIVNGLGSWNINEVWVDASDGPWTENRLTGTIEPGEEFTVELTEAGTYDIQVIDEDGDTYTMWLVDVDENGYEWEVTLDDLDWATEEVTITVENGLGSWDIWYIYGCTSDSDDWGFNQLESDVLAPGESTTFTVQSGDWYDFMAEDEDGDTYVILDQYIDGDFTWEVNFDYMDNSFALGAGAEGDAPVTIYNGLGDWTIWYIYCDPTSSDWGEDRLGSELLNPGEEYTFYVPAGDTYDIQVEDEDGDTYTLWGEYIDEAGIYWEVTLSDLD